MMARSRPKPPVRSTSQGFLLLLAFLSGASALIYESVWIRWFRLLFGSTTTASSVTLAAFFGGLALGAVAFGRRAARAERPLRAYAWIELGVALSALWVPLALLLYEPLYPLLYESMAGQRSLFLALKLALALASMLPTAVLLGGTLPMLGTALLGETTSLGRHGSRLYALNTLGAAVGAVFGALLLPEWIGVSATYAVAVVASLAVGAGAWFAQTPRRPEPRVVDDPAGRVERAKTIPLAIAAASGFGILAFEVLLIHALGQLYSHSAYSFGMVLLVALVSLGLGAALVSVSEGRVACATLLRASLALSAAFLLFFPWVHSLTGRAVIGVGLLVFLVGGMVFPLTFRLAPAGPAGARIGGLLAANTLGAILGSLGASFVLLPHVGLWKAIGWLGVLYGLAALTVAGSARARLITLTGLGTLGAIVVLGPLSPWVRPSVVLQEGDRLLAVEEGAEGIVSVVESREGNRRIKVDDVYQFGGSAEKVVSERTGHLPLLLHPAPRRVVFVGSATGGVAGAAVLHPVERIDLVEIVPEIQELGARYFTETNRGVHADPRTRLVTEDGRNHLRATADRYDVVVEDCFLPFQPSAAAMYTLDHYRDVKEHLTERGVFCQWLPIYQLDELTFLIIASTFLEVFPEGSLWRPHLRAHFPVVGLVGTAGRLPSVAEISERTRALAAAQIDDPYVTDPQNLWMLYVGSVADVFEFKERPRPHRDDHPYFEFVASRYDPAAVAQYRYLDWVRLNDSLARKTPGANGLFPDRPHALVLGANAMLRANLAQAGGAAEHMQQSVGDAVRHLPREVLMVKDQSFSSVWPR